MAFPSTISSLIETYHGVAGPFVSSTGTVYVVTRGSAANDIQIFKAADPASSWSSAGNLAVTSGNTVRHVNACQVSDVIHIVSRDAGTAASNQIRYHAFDMSSDSFTTSNELVKTTYTQKGTVDESMVGIVVRSAGDKIVLYEGPQVLADIQRARTYYARHLGSAWSADIALDNGGNVDWYPQEIILGLSNRVHFFFLDSTSNDLYQRTLTSANALESFPSAFDTSIAAGQQDVGFQRGIAYSASAGGTVVRFPYYDTFDPTLADVQFTSADAPSPLTVTTDITGAVDPMGIRRVISLAKDESTVYGSFINNSNPLRFDNAASTATTTLVNTTGLLLTATANATLLVFVNVASGNGTVSAVNVGATALTRLGAINYRTAAPLRAEIWGLTAAPTGTLTISAVVANAEVASVAIAAATYIGARITGGTPFGGVVAQSASAAATTSTVVSSSLGNLVVVGFNTTDPGVSIGGAASVRVTTTAAFPCIKVADTPGSSTATITANLPATTYWGNLGINLIASATVTKGVYLMSSQDAGSWSTPSLFQSGDISATWTNCYVRNSTRVIGVVYRENSTDLKYTEYTLSVGASTTIFGLRRAMLGIGR